MNRSFVSSPHGAVSSTDEFRRWIGAGLAAAMIVAAALTAWRRAAAALSQPLDVGPMLAAGLFWCCAAAISRQCWRRVPAEARPSADFPWLSGTLTLAAGVFGLSLSVAGTGAAGMTALWVALIAGEAVAWRPAIRRGDDGAPARPPQRDRGPTSATQTSAATAIHAALRRPVVPDAATLPGEELVQQLIRTQRPDGRQTLRGVVRVALAAGQRSASAHVAFCPPFTHTPHLEIATAGGPKVRIKTAQLMPFGTRLDLKLTEPATEPVVIDVRFSVVCEGSTRG